jgi:polysaccharide biosynthesis transport protein
MALRWPWQDIDLRFTLNTGGPVEPREFFDILRRRWLSMVAITLLTLASVAAMTLMMPKSYTATTRVFFAVSGDSVSGPTQGSSFVEKQMASYAEVATSPKVLNKVVEQLGLNTTAVELAESIEANVPLDTVILEIAATDPDPRQAARIANTVGTELSKAAGDLTPGLGNGSEAVRATTLSMAEVPTSPSSPNILRNLGVGLLGIPLGALLWLVLAKTLIVLGRRRLVEPYR